MTQYQKIRKNKNHTNSNNSNGFTHVIVLVAIIVLLFIGGSAYIIFAGHKNSNNETAALEKCLEQIKDENICRLSDHLNLNNYSSEVSTISVGKNSNKTLVTRYDGKGNYHYIFDDATESIYVDGVLYSYQDQWYVFGPSTGMTNDALDLPIIEIYDQGFSFEDLGTEDCGTEKCYKYKIYGGVLENDYVEILFSANNFMPKSLTTYLEEGGKIATTIEYKDILIIAPKNAVMLDDVNSSNEGLFPIDLGDSL